MPESTPSNYDAPSTRIKEWFLGLLASAARSLGKLSIAGVLIAAYMAGIGYFGTESITSIEGFDTTFATEEERQSVTPWIFAAFAGMGLVTIVVSALLLSILVFAGYVGQKLTQHTSRTTSIN